MDDRQHACTLEYLSRSVFITQKERRVGFIRSFTLIAWSGEGC